uniref:Uncharacterized protein n=1 Tax=Lepeophtheirus salmonis TaxID=72036 RepID=A0A0K2TIE4_LEPSM
MSEISVWTEISLQISLEKIIKSVQCKKFIWLFWRLMIPDPSLASKNVSTAMTSLVRKYGSHGVRILILSIILSEAKLNLKQIEHIMPSRTL